VGAGPRSVREALLGAVRWCNSLGPRGVRNSPLACGLRIQRWPDLGRRPCQLSGALPSPERGRRTNKLLPVARLADFRANGLTVRPSRRRFAARLNSGVRCHGKVHPRLLSPAGGILQLVSTAAAAGARRRGRKLLHGATRVRLVPRIAAVERRGTRRASKISRASDRPAVVLNSNWRLRGLRLHQRPGRLRLRDASVRRTGWSLGLQPRYFSRPDMRGRVSLAANNSSKPTPLRGAA
jgi:hypothetical protein